VCLEQEKEMLKLFATTALASMMLASAAYADVAVGSVQVNLQPLQTSSTTIGTLGVTLLPVGGDISVSTQAVGNNLSVETDDLSLSFASQTNNIGVQLATTTIVGALSGSDDDIDVTTAAVGNNIDVEVDSAGAALNLSGQTNSNVGQFAVTNITAMGSGLRGNIDVQTQAVGNALSIEADVFNGNLSGQSNTQLAQVASTTLLGASAGVGLCILSCGTPGGLSVGTTAVGNLANLTTENAIAGFGQVNLQGVQLAQTTIGIAGAAGNVDINTTAVGNSISIKKPGS